MKLCFVLATALLIWPSPPAAAEPPPMAAVGVLSFGRAARCSGTLVAPDLVLTAGHCVLTASGVGPVPPRRVEFRTGAYPGHLSRSYTADDIVVHPLYLDTAEDDVMALRYDAGLVRLASAVPEGIARPIEVAALSPGSGPETFVASYRAGRGERARERLCPIVREWPELVSFSCDVRPGESGSPILEAGPDGLRLVGIVSASSRLKRTEITFASRAEPLLGVLKAVMGGF